jgi:hypothetical protein
LEIESLRGPNIRAYPLFVRVQSQNAVPCDRTEKVLQGNHRISAIGRPSQGGINPSSIPRQLAEGTLKCTFSVARSVQRDVPVI